MLPAQRILVVHTFIVKCHVTFEVANDGRAVGELITYIVGLKMVIFDDYLITSTWLY